MTEIGQGEETDWTTLIYGAEPEASYMRGRECLRARQHYLAGTMVEHFTDQCRGMGTELAADEPGLSIRSVAQRCSEHRKVNNHHTRTW